MAENFITKNYGPSKLSSIKKKIDLNLKKIFKSVINSNLPDYKEASKHVFS